MQKVNGQIFIDKKEFIVCIKPSMHDYPYSWSISNFKEFDSWGNVEVHDTYQDGGPHISLGPSGVNFFKQIVFGKTIYSNNEVDGFIYGSMEMLQGRPACDLPSGYRRFEKLSMLVTRSEEMSRFEFSATAGESNEKYVPLSVAVDFWFEMPDSFINEFIKNAEANDYYRALILKYDSQEVTV